MRDLAGFREAVREHRRAVGRTQQQLARAIGLHPDVLSHKLNGHDGALLTVPDVIGIVTTLAAWGALTTRAEAEALLESMAVPPQALPTEAWAEPPLARLATQAPGPARPQQRPAAAAEIRVGPAQPGRGPARATAEVGLGPTPPAPGPTQLRLAPLPAPATDLIGRETERAEVAAALATSRLVTLTGVGGTGKTRLALQAASELAGGFADGVAFADLTSVTDPALMAAAIAAALGLTPSSAGAAEGQVTAALRDRQVLLVLDNAEQLVEGAPLLARVLAAAPELSMLVNQQDRAAPVRRAHAAGPPVAPAWRRSRGPRARQRDGAVVHYPRPGGAPGFRP